tara:strand:- start:54433 stop:54582 length:150 start_codon:yes stop_codon:yes gene_type:complete
MKEITANASDLARTVLTSVPPIILAMAGTMAVAVWGGLRLMAMLPGQTS